MLLAQQFPYVLVDESQDTAANVVEALKEVERQNRGSFCLGFFGDPMQRIYLTGVGDIPPEDGWAFITKQENFRCPTTILAVANSIRRPIGDVVQVRGRMSEHDGRLESVTGSANMFILPADDQREEKLAQVRSWVAQMNIDPAWHTDDNGKLVKVLVIIHRMAAKILGFGDLYTVFNDNAPNSFKNGFLDATAWPLRPYLSFVLPIVNALKQDRKFDILQILRNQSPLISLDSLKGEDVAKRLALLEELTNRLGYLMSEDSNATKQNSYFLT